MAGVAKRYRYVVRGADDRPTAPVDQRRPDRLWQTATHVEVVRRLAGRVRGSEHVVATSRRG